MQASEAGPHVTQPAESTLDAPKWQGSMRPTGRNQWSRRNHESPRGVWAAVDRFGQTGLVLLLVYRVLTEY
jgi:hypothetical protein